jgi:protein involved in polysaccharide export with SLBB domain
VGEFRVAGLQFRQLQEFLKVRFDRVYRNYDLNVNLGQLRSIQVFVTGEARRPGSYTISSLSTLVNAVCACGGPGPHGSLRHILVKRNGALRTDFDLHDLLQKGDKSKDASLETGDVIYFPPVGPQVAIVGSVNVPAIYELRGRESIGEVLSLAGGVSATAETSTLVIERTEKKADGSGARVAVDVAMDRSSLAAPLRNADIVRVRAEARRFDKTVTLRGNVATPGRFAWHEGMHVRDLIPNKESLLTPDYWLRREQLGLPVADFQPMLPPVKAESSPTQYYEAIFDVLAKQLELAKLDEAREGAFIQVVDPAVAPEQKSFPKRGMLTITGIAGGFTFGIMLALLQGGWRGCSIIPQPRTNWTF